MDDRSGCAEIGELLPDVAAGVAAGDERARVFAHLGGCPACRRELAALSHVADELLTLAPAVTPPAGFAASLMRRLAPPPRRRRWWPGRAARVALTVLLAAVAGSGATMRATADDRREAHHCRERPLAERALAAADGTAGGRAFGYGGSPPWLFLTVALPAAGGVYDVHLVTRDGRSRAIGAVPVSAGGGSWGVALDVPFDQVAEVRLAGSAGPPLAAAFG
ncbi:zf-HC2 domain-containing protein [Phytohabitans sp. ZYX-F-186]|uniref:Zf-HC2 domain-containing protein n=1 Tax=Phytohabitans maris TaxID=3071409 RepID=A0ABU0ZCJ3_9ACTN|nr:zf-HC2 domain-containing protein [Phytohabitans sp. ZYX-F-186]MDQ7904040.1 zf-HC2 domain-containing protein [Phytohabitans sp. ZYX-F-186]